MLPSCPQATECTMSEWPTKVPQHSTKANVSHNFTLRSHALLATLLPVRAAAIPLT